LHHTAFDLADGPRVDECLVAQVTGLVAALRAGDDAEAFGLGFFSGRDHVARADRIDRHRFFNETMLAGFHGGGEMHRAERRRSGHHHVFAIGGDHFLIIVIAVEATVRRDVEFFPGGISLVLEGIAHGGDFRLDAEDFASRHEVRQRAIAASAAADQADFDFLGCSRSVDAENRAGGEPCGQQGRGSEK